MLEEHYQERVFLAPPQVYELSRIHNLPNFKSVQEFALKRQTMGVERWLPVISTYNNGALSVLPGLTSFYVYMFTDVYCDAMPNIQLNPFITNRSKAFVKSESSL